MRQDGGVNADGDGFSTMTRVTGAPTPTSRQRPGGEGEEAGKREEAMAEGDVNIQDSRARRVDWALRQAWDVVDVVNQQGGSEEGMAGLATNSLLVLLRLHELLVGCLDLAPVPPVLAPTSKISGTAVDGLIERAVRHWTGRARAEARRGEGKRSWSLDLSKGLLR